jgi:hypothetical protein
MLPELVHGETATPAERCRHADTAKVSAKILWTLSFGGLTVNYTRWLAVSL